MTSAFRRPFAPPPLIYLTATIVGLIIDFTYPVPLMPLLHQLVIGGIVIVVGTLFIRASMTSMGRGGTTYSPYSASTALVTSGIYRYTRNPGYLGLAIFQLGVALVVDSPWVALTAFIAVFVVDQFVIRLEEQKLVDTFGQQYDAYRARVRRWL